MIVIKCNLKILYFTPLCFCCSNMKMPSEQRRLVDLWTMRNCPPLQGLPPYLQGGAPHNPHPNPHQDPHPPAVHLNSRQTEGKDHHHRLHRGHLVKSHLVSTGTLNLICMKRYRFFRGNALKASISHRM